MDADVTNRPAEGIKVLIGGPDEAAARGWVPGLGLDTQAVLVARDGLAVLSGLMDHRPDAVILDHRPPRLDAYRTCALIKSHPIYAKTPVFILCADDGLFASADARLAGATALIARPPSNMDLGPLLSTHLANAQRHADGRAGGWDSE